MARFNAKGLARLRAVMQSHIDNGRLPGAVVALGLGGHVEMLEALGQRDAASQAAMQADSIFRIYSMTKPLVSLATLMLVEEGRLQLVDPIAKYLPAFTDLQVGVEEGGALRTEPALRQPTVHDLLRHTAGFTYGFLGNSAVQRAYQAAELARRSRSNAQFCDTLAQLPLAHQPGSCWQYSHSTDVLGALIEVVAGQSLGALLAERIFLPLGMTDTAFSVPSDKWQRLAEPFARDPDSGEPVVMMNAREVPAFESGGGGLVSTAGDYIRFLQLMRNRGSLAGTRLVSRKTIEWMTADHLGAIPAHGDLLMPGYGFGLGFSVRMQAGLAPLPGSVGQYFWSGIGGTLFFVDPAEDLFALMLTQAPNQRIFFRHLFRHLVYAALD